MANARVLLLCTGPLLLLLSACEERTQFRPELDAGIDCGNDERLIHGECVFVCDRDSDCPTDQRCNLFSGQCEPRPAVEDAGVVTYPCTTGAVRCRNDQKAVEACTEDGTWMDQEVCQGDGFCQNGTCLQCQPGQTRCNPSDPAGIQVCPPDGSGWQSITCHTGGTCVQGECRECAPNSTRCSPDGKNAQICEKDTDPALTWKWANAGDNFDGTCITQQCVAGDPAVCKAPECIPGATRCGGPATQEVCSATGSWTSQACTSLTGMGPSAECQNGVCLDQCAEAAKLKTYFGCEYWSAVQDNGLDRFFKAMPLHTNAAQGTADSEFAFAVSNQSALPTTVEVFRWFNGAEAKVKTVVVPGKNDATTRGLAVIKLPWQSIGYTDQEFVTMSVTGQARFGYRLTSTRPVTVYQFNPLDAARVTKTCSGAQNQPDSSCNELPNYSGGFFGDPNTWGLCKTPAAGGARRCHYYTYSNDASLLLPAHALGTSHVVISQEHSTYSDFFAGDQEMNGHVTIVATADATTVTVKSSAKTRASPSNYTPTISSLNKGQTATFTLNRYDVLQLATDAFGGNLQCAGSVCRRDNDLTGTVITSTSPVAVFGGATCTNKPFNMGACDHVEEQIFPFATWGKTFVAQRSHPVRLVGGAFATASQMAADYYKVVASCPASQCPAGTLLTFSTPPAAADVLPPNRCLSGTLSGNNCRLAGGSFMEFRTKQDFTLTADQPIAVAQFFAGQQATTNADQGDPSFILLPPVEQWRTEYTVLTAPGIRDNYIGIVYDSTRVSEVQVDGVTISGFNAINGTNFQAKNHPVTVGVHTVKVLPKPGANQIPAAGVTVYGFDSYVSYGYTGGLDLSTIVSGINPGG